jgi:hypothetical protein
MASLAYKLILPSSVGINTASSDTILLNATCSERDLAHKYVWSEKPFDLELGALGMIKIKGYERPTSVSIGGLNVKFLISFLPFCFSQLPCLISGN